MLTDRFDPTMYIHLNNPLTFTFLCKFSSSSYFLGNKKGIRNAAFGTAQFQISFKKGKFKYETQQTLQLNIFTILYSLVGWLCCWFSFKLLGIKQLWNTNQEKWNSKAHKYIPVSTACSRVICTRSQWGICDTREHACPSLHKSLSSYLSYSAYIWFSIFT